MLAASVRASVKVCLPVTELTISILFNCVFSMVDEAVLVSDVLE